MKTFEVKVSYSTYLVMRVEAEDENDALEKGQIQANESIDQNVNSCKMDFGEEAERDVITDLVINLDRWPEADEVEEVDLESEPDEDRVTFDGPTGWPDQGFELDRLIEREG